MFSCWVVKTKSVAVEYVKKYESFQETSLMWGYGLQYIGGYVIFYYLFILLSSLFTIDLNYYILS